MQVIKVGIVVVLLLCAANAAWAQTQTVRGLVTDVAIGEPLAGATIRLLGTDELAGYSDVDGTFEIAQVPVGRYHLEISYVGYTSYTISNLLVKSGKEVVVEAGLQAQALETIPVTIRAQSVGPFAGKAETVSARTISVEQTQRYAATYYDPARLATSFPGVIATSDQANNLVIRGNGPTSLRWRLEGVDIVNPNHTANAGTFSDRPTSSGGGVNILSGQMLGMSSFLSSAFPAGYGDAVGGVMDMSFRNGNAKNHEFVLQAGLLGIDVAAEGPLRKNSKASFLVNYRYSFVGILGLMGVDFDGEKIAFQDLSFNVNYPLKRGSFKVFAVAGQSSNVFTTARDSTQWTLEKHLQDIDYRSQMGALGGRLTRFYGKNYLMLSVVASGVEHDRESQLLSASYEPEPFARDALTESKISAHAFASRTPNNYSKATVGVLATSTAVSNTSAFAPNGTLFGGAGNYAMLQPYLRYKTMLGDQWTVRAGLQYAYATITDAWLPEPRISVQRMLGKHQRSYLMAAAGLHSQLQRPEVYFSAAGGSDAPLNLGATRARHYVLAYNLQAAEHQNVRVEAYYQQLFDVPVALQPNSFSMLNTVEAQPTFPLINTGTGTNMGVELSTRRTLHKGIYYLLSGTLFDSRYTGSDGVERSTAWNASYAVSGTAGREWRWNYSKGERSFSINVRSAWIGGMRETPIDYLVSQQEGTTVWHNDLAWNLRLADYFKTDLRFMLTSNTKKRTTSWAIDIQNAFNRKNEAFRYYDSVAGEIITKTQLGIIPLLTWRLEL